MAIEKGNKIKADYEGRFENGEIFDTSSHGDHSHPLEFEVGAGQVIKGFDDAVIGMEKGDEKEITIPPSEAYGEIDESLEQKVPREALPPLPEGKKLEVGMQLMLKTPEGHYHPVSIKDLTDKEVVIDLNHPLAGKTLIFKIKIIDYQ